MGILYDLVFGVFILTALAATLGNFIDKKLHTSPFLAISLGLAAIVFGLIRLVVKANQLEEKEKQNKSESDNK